MGSWAVLKKEVLTTNLCCYCGTCIGVCPNNAIDFGNEEIFLKGTCNSCGACVKVCPGKGFDYQEFTCTLFDKYSSKDDKNLGKYLNVYVGHSMENQIREKAGSGGVVGQLLVTLLDRGEIDGAVVLKGKDGLNHKVEVNIARSREEIIHSLQSKYIRYPSNNILRKLKSLNGRYAYVGTPCQIHGLRKAAKLDRNLTNNIVLYIGLFCGFNLTRQGTVFLINQLKLTEDKIKRLEYRGLKEKGFVVEDQNGNLQCISKHGYTFVNLAFSPERCWQCPDFTAEFADISVGDAWEKNNEIEKWSRIITRTPAGQRALDICTESETIYIDESWPDVLINQQSHLFRHKKIWFWVRRPLIKNNPDFGLVPNNYSFKDYLYGMILFGTYKFLNIRLGRLILSNVSIKKLQKASAKMWEFIKNEAGKE